MEASVEQGASWAEQIGDEAVVGGGNEHATNKQLSDKQAEDPEHYDAGDASSANAETFRPSGESVSDEYDPGAVVILDAASGEEEEAADSGGEEGESDENEGDEEEDGQEEEEGEEAGDKGGDAEQDDAGRVAAPAAESPVRSPAPSLPQRTAKRPKAKGGFLVGDSDSEDDDGGNGPAAANQQGAPHNAAADIPMDGSDSYEPAPFLSSTANDAPTAQPAQLPMQLSMQPPAPAAAGAPMPQHPVAVTAPSLEQPDEIALLEASIQDDPRGAMDCWLELISRYRRTNRFDKVRSVYNRFLQVFPQTAAVWIMYIDMELELDNFAAAEDLFAKSLTKVLNVALWVVYLDYVRRRNSLVSDASGEARKVVNRAYEFVLDNIGLDKDSGRIWQDYIQFIRSGPGNIGDTGWQNQQKMDQLRRAFRRATSIPISNVNQLWKEYDQFEMGLNKITGRKFLAERSPAYMSAKSANTALENITRGLDRTTIPRLPPVAGFDGHQEYMTQVDLWQKWIAWEKSDPLDLGIDEPEALKSRILYCYKQALIPLRFWPDLWVEAAEWCFENNVRENGREKGVDFLLDGIEANPESVMLALKHADRLESTIPVEEGEQAKIARGQAVRAPYDKIINTLRDLHKSLQDREKAAVARIEEAFAVGRGPGGDVDGDNKGAADMDDDDYQPKGPSPSDEEKAQKVSQVREGFAAQMDLVSKCLTHVWIALARAMRRIQGKGSPQGPLGGMRQVFSEARKGGRLKSDIYVEIAKMEWKCYNDKAGGKILERGARLFPEDPYFMIEYIKYLTAHGDNTNSRVVFETCVNRLAQNRETVHKAKPLLAYMHKREAKYGDLSRVLELEKRMAELYPDDPKLVQFSKRFSTEKFDPVGARIIVSTAAQLRPRPILPSVEQPTTNLRDSPFPIGGGGGGGGGAGAGYRQQSPRILFPGRLNSPKRPFQADDLDEANPPRKLLRSADQREFQRGESPLKGAAGRRLDQQRRLQGGHGGQGGYGAASTAGPPPPLPTMINFLLGQIPPAAQYNGVRYSAAGLVHLIRETDVDPNTWESARKGGAKSGRGPAQPYGRGGATSSMHSRQVSNNDYSQYLGGSRNSPAPGGGSGGGYRQSSLRPDSRESYEPPPPVAAAAAAGMANVYGQYGAGAGAGAAPAYDNAAAAAAAAAMAATWQQVPPAAGVSYQQAASGYAPQPPQQPPYGGYRYP